MNKFLNIGNIVLGADINYVSIDALGGTITLSYSDKQIVLTLASTPTQVDKNAINTAIVAAWSQPYYDSSIDVTLSSAITTVA
mgnify:FL=1|tara:strand:+ start:214 stop:462 length:249 start_codon:yes stop_codon:yes gene_type:complete